MTRSTIVPPLSDSLIKARGWMLTGSKMNGMDLGEESIYCFTNTCGGMTAYNGQLFKTCPGSPELEQVALNLFFFSGAASSLRGGKKKFDGATFLSKLKGKKILFVGDSLSFNQWQSLACLIHATKPNAKYDFKPRQSIKFPEYGVSITLITDHFLVDLVQDQMMGRVMKLDSISNGDAWKGYDVMIFNTYHWWNHQGRLQPYVINL
ncbi:hypothetical protein ACFE04_006449 [Oxalis oulophora]